MSFVTDGLAGIDVAEREPTLRGFFCVCVSVELVEIANYFFNALFFP